MEKGNVRKLAIDGDMLLYRACVGLEDEFCWDDSGDWWTRHVNLPRVRTYIREQIGTWMKELDAGSWCIAFSSTTNWRNSVLPSYKSNRKNTRKPTGYHVLKAEYLAMRDVRNKPTVSYRYAHLEADDVLGYLASMPGTATRYVIVGEDKDFNQIVGDKYNPFTKVLTKTTPDQAVRFHLYQTLCGDATDGYKGCPGIGDKKANAILDADMTWAAIVRAYEAADLTEADALVQARVAKILRHSDYNVKTGDVKLWDPLELEMVEDVE